MNICYGVGDSGNVVREINFRLAGFGGVLPGNTFTRNTGKSVKQFQRDYMKISVPTGIVDEATLQKTNEFSDKYREFHVPRVSHRKTGNQTTFISLNPFL